MRFSVAVQLGLLLTSVAATGPRGAAERVLIWESYLADGVMEGSRVAPGCGREFSADPKYRCTLAQLCQYLWKETVDAENPKKIQDDVRPKVSLPSVDADPNSHTYKELHDAIYHFRDTESHPKLNGGIMIIKGTDAQRAWPGCADWYDMLSRMGGPIKDLEDHFVRASTPLTKVAQGIVNLGKQAATTTWQLRIKESETHRMKFFREQFATLRDRLPEEIRDKYMKTGFVVKQEKIPAIDSVMDRIQPDAIKKWFQKRAPNFDITAEMHRINDEHWAKDINFAHKRAIESAQVAALALDCPINVRADGL